MSVFAVSASDIYIWALLFIIALFPLYFIWYFFTRYYHHKSKVGVKKHTLKDIHIETIARAHHKDEHAHHFKEKWYETRIVTHIIPLLFVFIILLWLLIAMINSNNRRLAFPTRESEIISQKEFNEVKKEKEKPKKEHPATQTVSSGPLLRFGDTSFISKLQAAKSLSAAESALQGFMDYYGLDMQLTKITKTAYEKSGQFKFTRPKSSHLDLIKTYGSMFIDEWAKYPNDFMQSSKLKSVAFVVGLKVDYGHGHREVAATYDVIEDIMIYDISFGASTYSESVVHHEFNHLVEYNQNNTYSRPNSNFTSCNPVAYGEGGASAYEDDNYSYTQHPKSGFVTTYAMTAIEEDRAELFGYLMQEDNYAKLKAWNQSDSCLNTKTDVYQGYIQSLSPTMNSSYYDAIN